MGLCPQSGGLGKPMVFPPRQELCIFPDNKKMK
jgi:hypothetical protein